ncbi:MAG: GDP/UDP-N,N'-diacetylbacillosamine 2-epimerase (hydrolyzing) [Arenicella sp.]|jgi:GDP/UDP-N,N'-diacetylbacillosamine 2-epimerase (hydrolysing)
MKVGVLTSSRADFGIYLPLLHALQNDDFFDLEIIAFGTHLSKEHGFTLDEIKTSGFEVKHALDTLKDSNTPQGVAYSIATTTETFSKFWAENEFDLLVALGDRYEMYAAVLASSPFDLEIAHIHAGETTLGAIDNAYRHSISLFSKYLFVSTDNYKKRAEEIVEDDVEVHNVGALSVDNLSKMSFLSIPEFKEKFKIDLELPTILSTFHPETVQYEKNETHISELLSTMDDLQAQYQIVITMPNTDTMGQMVRDKINDFKLANPNIILVESFGMLGYLSCMKHCKFLLGNTSSGFVEAAYFPKYVINLGDRQKGRLETENILTIPIIKSKILEAVHKVENSPQLQALNTYGTGNTAEKIISIFKTNG